MKDSVKYGILSIVCGIVGCLYFGFRVMNM